MEVEISHSTTPSLCPGRYKRCCGSESEGPRQLQSTVRLTPLVPLRYDEARATSWSCLACVHPRWGYRGAQVGGDKVSWNRYVSYSYVVLETRWLLMHSHGVAMGVQCCVGPETSWLDEQGATPPPLSCEVVVKLHSREGLCRVGLSRSMHAESSTEVHMR